MPPVFGTAATSMLVGGAERRRDCWPSKADAYKVLKARGTWKAWDDRVLRTYVVLYISSRCFILISADMAREGKWYARSTHTGIPRRRGRNLEVHPRAGGGMTLTIPTALSMCTNAPTGVLS